MIYTTPGKPLKIFIKQKFEKKNLRGMKNLKMFSMNFIRRNI